MTHTQTCERDLLWGLIWCQSPLGKVACRWRSWLEQCRESKQRQQHCEKLISVCRGNTWQSILPSSHICHTPLCCPTMSACVSSYLSLKKKEGKDFVSSSLSLHFLAVGPRLSPSGLGGVTPGREKRWEQDCVVIISDKQFLCLVSKENVGDVVRTVRSRTQGSGIFFSDLCDQYCVQSVLPSLVQVKDEEEFISEVGKLMRGGEGYWRGEKGGTGAQICDQGVDSLVGRGEEGQKVSDWTSILGAKILESRSHSLCTSTLSPAGGSQTSTGPDREAEKHKEHVSNRSQIRFIYTVWLRGMAAGQTLWLMKSCGAIDRKPKA